MKLHRSPIEGAAAKALGKQWWNWMRVFVGKRVSRKPAAFTIGHEAAHDWLRRLLGTPR
jgi:hypothetical protein